MKLLEFTPFADPAQLDPLVDEAAREVRARVTIVAPDDRVLADSAVKSGSELAALENHGSRPEMREALARGEGTSVRKSATLGADLLYAAVPIRHQGKLLGLARVALPLEDVEEQARDLRGAVGAALGVAFLNTDLLSLGLSSSLAGPLRWALGLTLLYAGVEFNPVPPQVAGHVVNTYVSPATRSTEWKSRGHVDVVELETHWHAAVTPGRGASFGRAQVPQTIPRVLGIARVEPLEAAARYDAWLAAHRHGDMSWLASPKHRERRADPARLLPGIRSVLCVALCHPPGRDTARDRRLGRIARYAAGEDYHRIMKDKLLTLERWIQTELFPGSGSLWYSDTGAILDRGWAERAGIGWSGKHSGVLSQSLGSWFLLGEVLVDRELEPDAPLAREHCGTCVRCLEV